VSDLDEAWPAPCALAVPQTINKVTHHLAAQRGRWLPKAAKTMLATTGKD